MLPIHIELGLPLENPDRERLIGWRKECVQARERWLALQKEYGREDRSLAALAKGEAADCLKHERACTQILEMYDGKRAGLGELKGDKYGFLAYRVPLELMSAFRFCATVAQ
jgi:hypothetical protein